MEIGCGYKGGGYTEVMIHVLLLMAGGFIKIIGQKF